MNVGFYFIKPEFFNLVNSGLEFTDSDSNRHMYFICPFEQELWAIPLSSQYEKYKEWYKQAKKENKKNRFIIFVNTRNKDGALLIQNAFPISEYFIDRKAMSSEGHITLDTNLIDLIKKRLRDMKILETRGILNFHSDVNLIRSVLKKRG